MVCLEGCSYIYSVHSGKTYTHISGIPFDIYVMFSHINTNRGGRYDGKGIANSGHNMQ